MSEKKRLSSEEKLNLMQEYMDKTGEKIKANTEYKGYKLGNMQNNLRQSYFNGTLKMEENLLKRFEELGILQKEKQRKTKTTQQEKYEFLMKMAEKSEDERQRAKMDSGLTVLEVIRQIQSDYNRGKLGLTEKQIENLRKKGFLGFSKEEREDIAKKYGIPAKYIIDIIEKYGSYEAFIKQYKKGKIDYDFQGEVFCGYRGITLSEEEITESQKLAYANLVERIRGKFRKKESLYIDIDKLNLFLGDKLEEIEHRVIELRFGLNGEKNSLEECRKKFNLSCERIRQIEAKAIRKMKNPKIMEQYVRNIEHDKTRVEKCKKEIETTEKCIEGFDKIKSLFEGADEKTKKSIREMRLEDLGITGIEVSDGEEAKTVQDLIDLAEREKKKEYEKLLATPIEYLGVPVRTVRPLKDSGINNINDLIKLSKEDLGKIKTFGTNTVEEVAIIIKALGLKMREESQEVEEREDNKSQDSTIETFFEMYGKTLKEYSLKLEELKKEYDDLKKKIERYDIAYENYLSKEDLFNPNAIVPAIQEKTLEAEENPQEEISSNVTEAEQTSESEINEQEKRKTLLESILAGQKQLEELRKILAKFGLEGTISQ